MVTDIGLLPGWCYGSLQPPSRLFWNGTASAIAPAVRRWEAQISKDYIAAHSAPTGNSSYAPCTRSATFTLGRSIR